MLINREESRTKKKNRQRILDSARVLFLNKGLHSTTMQDIADKAQVERRTLYNYYDNKELLAMDLQVGYLNALNEAWIVVDPSLSGFDQARILLTSFCDYCIEHPDLINFTVQFDHYFRDSYDNADYEAFMKDHISKRSEFSKTLKIGMADGSIFIDPHLVDKTANTIIQAIMGLAQRVIYREDIYKKEHNMDREDIRLMVDVILFGLKS